MKILEDWGRKKVTLFYSLFKQRSTRSYRSVDALFHDKIVYFPITLAFVIGFVFTLPIVLFEVFVGIEMSVEGLSLYLFVLVASVFLEFYFLFLLGFATLGYYIHHLYLIDRRIHRLGEPEFRASLIRTAMELPEKKIVSYNVDPYEYKEKKILLLTLLYKAKVVLTNVVAKFLLKKLLSRTSLRGFSAFIAAPITGAWDAAIFLQTMRRARYKLVVRFVMRYLLSTKMPLLIRHTRMTLLRYYYFGEYCNNFNMLLQRIYQQAPFTDTKEEYLAEDITEGSARLFALLLAFKQSSFTSKEKELAVKLGINDEVKRIQTLIKQADIVSIQDIVDTL